MRLKPYTEAGIKRLKCFRCGEPAQTQWQICADHNQYRPVCIECDIDLNRLVLRFMGFKDWLRKIIKYRTKIYRKYL